MRNTIIAAALAVAGPTSVAAQQAADTSLYARLGGVYAIASVVDDFLERLLADSVVNANPRIDAARKAVPRAGLKYRVTELVCQVTGGPCTYSGRSMKQAHAHLNIGEAEWQALLRDFRASLAHFKVPAREQQQLIAIVESTKPDIVTAR
ncbi:MAG: group I truncated hemoglobin [Gemmatimonadales bacterium]